MFIVLVLGAAGISQVPWHEYLAIREIAVEGGERIQTETVLQKLPIQIGANWLTADSAAARQALLALRDVREAHVQKAFWGRVRVRLSEREPLAVVRLQNGEHFWLDTEGFLFQPVQPESVFGPSITGLETVQTERGLRLADLFYLVPIRTLFGAPGLLLNAMAALRFDGSACRISMRAGYEVLLTIYDLKGELPRLQRVLRVLEGRRLGTVDLRFERLVIVQERRTHD